MNAGQMAAMAEATRLTRQGRLAEATALAECWIIHHGHAWFGGNPHGSYTDAHGQTPAPSSSASSTSTPPSRRAADRNQRSAPEPARGG